MALVRIAEIALPGRLGRIIVSLSVHDGAVL